MSKKAHETALPKLRFPEFRGKEAWEEKELGKLGKFTGGGTPSKENGDFWQGNIPWISSSDISEDSIYQVKITRFITKDALNDSATKLIPENSILLVSRVGVGKLAITKEAVCTSQDFTNFTPTKDDLVFLAYYIKTRSQDLISYSQGMAIKGFTKDDISTLKLFLPLLSEQQKIAAALSSLDALITAQTDKLTALQAHKRGLMQDLFPAEGETVPKRRFPEFRNVGEWVEKKLKDCLELLTDFEANGSFADVKKNVRVSDIPSFAWYVRATDLENNTALDKVKYVDQKGYDFLRKTSLSGGELLVAKRGEIGKLFFFETKDNMPATVAPNLYLLKMNEKAVPKFFFYFFSTAAGNQSLKRLNASSTIGALYKDDVKNIKIYAPPFAEQQKIADCLSSLDNLITAQNQTIEALKLHKKGLMQALFPIASAQEASA